MRLFKYLLAVLIAITPLASTKAGWFPRTEPSAAPVSNACSAISGTVVTFNAQSVGGASTNRITVVTINWSDSTAAGTAELNTVTVGGISMARYVRATGDNQNSNSEIWYVSNPSGTTANIVATFSTAVDGITIGVYSLVGYSLVPGVATVGTTSVSQGYNNKQLAIAVASRTVNVSTSLSNMVNDFSSACGTGLWGVHASQSLRGNSQTLTSAISPTSNNPKIALAVWTTNTPVIIPPPLDGLVATGAWSPSRKLYTAYGGSFYTPGAVGVATLLDQSGNLRDLNASGNPQQPTISGLGMLFDSTLNQFLRGPAITNFITATDGYMVITARPTGFTNGDGVLLNLSSFNAGMLVQPGGGSPVYDAYNGGDTLKPSVVANTTYVFEWRHEGGVLYQRINGAGETSIVTGNTNLVGGVLDLGGRFLSNNSMEGIIYEAAVFSTVPTQVQRDALVQALGQYSGAF